MRPLGRPRRSWEDNIKKMFEKWDLAQDRERWQGFCECGNVYSGSIKCGEFFDWLRTC
jgi:hypothetical protein